MERTVIECTCGRVKFDVDLSKVPAGTRWQLALMQVSKAALQVMAIVCGCAAVKKQDAQNSQNIFGARP